MVRRDVHVYYDLADLISRLDGSMIVTEIELGIAEQLLENAVPSEPIDPGRAAFGSGVGEPLPPERIEEARAALHKLTEDEAASIGVEKFRWLASLPRL